MPTARTSEGVHIHQMTEVTGIDVENNKVVAVQTNRGRIKTGMVLNATAGWASAYLRYGRGEVAD